MLLLRPPRPTLFPYTTLFRSQRVQNAVLGPTGAQRIHGDTAPGHGNGEVSDEGLQSRLGRTHADPRRSEEHTSELQSLRHLVCRLLLEKKKKEQETHKYRPTT